MEIRLFITQTVELTLASLKARYRKTWAGFLWVIMNPLLLFGVQSLVFKRFLRIDVPDYHLFLIGGLLPWVFITSTIQMGTPVFVSQSSLLKSFKINPWVILGAQVLDSFLNFLVSFLLVLLPFYFSSDNQIVNLIFLPVALMPILLGTLAFTIILSVLNIFYRDINFVMGFVFNLLFFLTPIFYPIEYVPSQFHSIMDLNPFLYLIEPFQIIVHAEKLEKFPVSIAKSFFVCALALLTAYIVWRKKQNDFYRKL